MFCEEETCTCKIKSLLSPSATSLSTKESASLVFLPNFIPPAERLEEKEREREREREGGGGRDREGERERGREREGGRGGDREGETEREREEWRE